MRLLYKNRDSITRLVVAPLRRAFVSPWLVRDFPHLPLLTPSSALQGFFGCGLCRAAVIASYPLGGARDCHLPGEPQTLSLKSLASWLFPSCPGPGKNSRSVRC